MAQESSKAMRRRDLTYMKYFAGTGIDVGCGPELLFKWKNKFHKMYHIRRWDLPDGDGQYLRGVDDNSVDFVHSSHSLEHMVMWRTALDNWIRVVRPGGYVIVCVPDWEMYEHKTWPSRYNSDHKWAWSLDQMDSGNHIVNLSKQMLERDFPVDVKVLQRITAGYNWAEIFTDQTAGEAECAIEFILQKKC